MKICAIVCEYNPFHTGHLYQLMQASKEYDEIICVMSGNFTQRAEPACVEKYTRATVALNAGASMVIELPVIFATANGEKFADGAIKSVSSLCELSGLVMGCETNDTDYIKILANIQSEENERFKNILTENLNDGKSYATAIMNATAVVGAENYGIPFETSVEILSQPNNLLCIEYVKASKKYCPKAEITLIKRIGVHHNSLFPTNNYASGTAIRNMLSNGDFTGATPYLPDANLTIGEYSAHPLSSSLFSSLAVYSLRNAGIDGIRKAYDCKEGLEYKLYENALTHTTIEEVLSETKSKRYTMSRIRRVILQVMLGIDKEIYKTDGYVPPRLLAIKENFKPILGTCGDKLIIRNDDFARYDSSFYEKYFEIERKASNLYSLITNNNENLFIPSKLYSI